MVSCLGLNSALTLQTISKRVGGGPLSAASVAKADMHNMGRDRGRDARSLLKSKQQSTATGVRGRLQKDKYLSERILERRKHFSFGCKSFRKLFIFPMKTFSLNSKQLFFSRLLFTKEGRVSALPFFIRPPQNVKQASRLGLRSHFSEREKKKKVL